VIADFGGWCVDEPTNGFCSSCSVCLLSFEKQPCFKHFAWSHYEASFQLVPNACLSADRLSGLKNGLK